MTSIAGAQRPALVGSRTSARLVLAARERVRGNAAALRVFDITLARARSGRGPHVRRIVLRPSHELVGAARRFKVRLVAVGTDAAGNSVTVSRRVTVAG